MAKPLRDLQFVFYNLNGRQGLKGVQAAILQEIKLALKESHPSPLKVRTWHVPHPHKQPHKLITLRIHPILLQPSIIPKVPVILPMALALGQHRQHKILQLLTQ